MPIEDSEFWIDVNLPPKLAHWLSQSFAVKSFPFFELGLIDATDEKVFELAQKKSVVIVTKDEDFADLVLAHGSPPKIIWITIGNTTNSELRKIISVQFKNSIHELEMGSDLVEITRPRE